MFFKNLVPVLEKMDLQFTLQLRDGKITFMAIPKKLDGKAFDMKPLSGSGTPEAVDEGFIRVFDAAIGKNVDLIVNLDEVEDSIKNRKAKATPTTSSTPGIRTVAPPVAKKTFLGSKPVKTNKTEVKIWEEIKKAGEEMGKRINDNPDLYNFYWNQIKDKIKLIKSVKDIETLVKEYFDGIRDNLMAKTDVPKDTPPADGLFENSSLETVLPDDSNTKKDDTVKTNKGTKKPAAKTEAAKKEDSSNQPHIQAKEPEDDGFKSPPENEENSGSENENEEKDLDEGDQGSGDSPEGVEEENDNVDTDDEDENTDDDLSEEDPEIVERDPNDEDAGIDSW